MAGREIVGLSEDDEAAIKAADRRVEADYFVLWGGPFPKVCPGSAIRPR
jgi:hypothetical protein